jgi:hypothetical protein
MGPDRVNGFFQEFAKDAPFVGLTPLTPRLADLKLPGDSPSSVTR